MRVGEGLYPRHPYRLNQARGSTQSFFPPFPQRGSAIRSTNGELERVSGAGVRVEILVSESGLVGLKIHFGHGLCGPGDEDASPCSAEGTRDPDGG